MSQRAPGHIVGGNKSNKLSQCWLLSSIKRVVSQKRRLVSMETFLKRRGKPKGREGSVWQCLKAKANAL